MGSRTEDRVAYLGLGFQAKLSSWFPALLPCREAEEVLESRTEWALEHQLPVWCAVKLLVASLRVVSCFNIITGNKPKLSCGVHSCGGHSPFHLRPAFLHQDSISGAMRGFEQASPSWFWGFSLLMETLGSLRSKPFGKRQHLLSHRVFHVRGEGG